jgi:hypothetical protein
MSSIRNPSPTDLIKMPNTNFLSNQRSYGTNNTCENLGELFLSEIKLYQNCTEAISKK